MSVFDIYFRSPVVSISKRYKSENFPSRRLVFIVADGLRASSFYEQFSRASFLKGRCSEFGLCGISNTGVPTESRPGHVALFAGMNEDPSAITKGWTSNPVKFDTVFNQSDYSFAWGSPDIISCFANEKMETFTYSSQFEDFSSNDFTQLDEWVFKEVESFFINASNPELDSSHLQMKLRSHGVILFLHLLGVDTNGHVHKPESEQYIGNIQMIDFRIKNIESIIRRYWRDDGRTTFIFTSDHGMTNWGSHGSGMSDETETPFVAWGAGIQNSSYFHQIRQIDIAPLIATLLGIAIPGNSMGKLPVELMNVHPEHEIQNKLVNCRQLYEQYKSFQEPFQNCFFQNPPMDSSHKIIFENRIEELKKLHRYKDASRLADEYFEEIEQGIQYYRKYHQTTLYILVLLTYILFIFYVFIQILKRFSYLLITASEPESKRNPFNLLAFLMTLFPTLLFSFFQNQPVYYIIYIVPPLWLIFSLKAELSGIQFSPNIQKSFVPLSIKLVFQTFLLVVVLESCIFSFLDRRLLSVSILSFVCLQISLIRRNRSENWIYRFTWISLALLLCIFTFTPAVGAFKNPHCVLLSSFFPFFLNLRVSFGSKALGTMSLLSGLIVWISGVYHIVFQSLSWILLLTALPLSLWLSFSSQLLSRLLFLGTALFINYTLLSVSYESLFLLLLSSAMYLWLCTEHFESFSPSSLFEHSFRLGKSRTVIEPMDVFRVIFYFFFAVLSFFGTGNIASINSFDPRSIATFVSVFNPFVMAFLLLLKILIPFLFVSLFMVCVTQVTCLSSRALFYLLLSLSNIVSLHFFFMVSDSGSWLEIGTSLSHFVIAQGLAIFLQFFHWLSQILFSFEKQSYSYKDF